MIDMVLAHFKNELKEKKLVSIYTSRTSMEEFQ